MENDKKFVDPLSTTFNLEEKNEITVISPREITTVEKKEDELDFLDADYVLARDTLIATILQAKDNLDEASTFAKMAQSASAWEAVTLATKVVLDGSKDLLELTNKRKRIKVMDAEESPDTVNNNLFVGTTADLQRLLKDAGVNSDVKKKTTSE